jgi:hypothetical protein
LAPNSAWFHRENYMGLEAIAKLKPAISVSQGDVEMRQLAAQQDLRLAIVTAKQFSTSEIPSEKYL